MRSTRKQARDASRRRSRRRPARKGNHQPALNRPGRASMCVPRRLAGASPRAIGCISVAAPGGASLSIGTAASRSISVCTADELAPNVGSRTRLSPCASNATIRRWTSRAGKTRFTTGTVAGPEFGAALMDCAVDLPVNTYLCPYGAITQCARSGPTPASGMPEYDSSMVTRTTAPGVAWARSAGIGLAAKAVAGRKAHTITIQPYATMCSRSPARSWARDTSARCLIAASVVLPIHFPRPCRLRILEPC